MITNAGYMQTNTHLHRFFKLNTASLLMGQRVFPNLKEITESMGAFVAIHNHITPIVDRNDKNVDVFCVGDGHSPRTAALIASLTKWNCHSIDPQMRNKKWDFKRLTTYRTKIQDVTFTGKEDKTALIVCVHSHASLKDSVKSISGYGNTYLINIPCCVKPDLEQQPFVSYLDYGIHSEKREVSIYKTLTP
jgi:hypothetical protein